MSILYEQQQKVVDKILKRLSIFDFQLLTGEVGSGKTYMGCEIAKQYAIKEKSVLIISPTHVKKKWQSVLKETTNSTELLDRITISSSIPKNVEEYDLVIYDEIHTLKSKKSKFKYYAYHRFQHFVGLTGSIVDKDVSDITNLVNTFVKDSSNFMNYNSFRRNSILNVTRYEYVKLYLQSFIITGISRNEISQELRQDEDNIIVNVNNLPIKMNLVESAFYDFASSRMDSLKLSSVRQFKILNESLDRTSKSEVFRLKGQDYYIGDRLIDDNPLKTQTLKKLLNSLNENVVVYTLDHNLAKRLADKIDNLTYFDSSKSHHVEQSINDLLTHSNVVLNILPIITGIDIESNAIIWYQTPLTLTQDIQGVGRITRLSSSDDEKSVYYLYHKNTKQEELIDKIKKNRELNNELIRKNKLNNQKSNTLNIPFAECLIR